MNTADDMLMQIHRNKRILLCPERRSLCMIPKDPVMLLSFVNLKLRDYYDSLEKLCEDLDIDQSELEDKLASIDYHYHKEQNKFV